MAGKRLSTKPRLTRRQRALLEPRGELFRQAMDVSALSDGELKELRIAAERCNSSNCSWYTFAIRGELAKHAALEQRVRRENRARDKRLPKLAVTA